jgi:hypothetical protein
VTVPARSVATVFRSLAIALLAYVMIDGLLGMLLQAAFPGQTDGQGHATGMPLLLGDLTVHGAAVFLSSALAAGAGSGPSWRVPIAASGVVFALILGLTVVVWDAEPAWFNIACVLMTPPFQLMGIGWQRAGRPDSHA